MKIAIMFATFLSLCTLLYSSSHPCNRFVRGSRPGHQTGFDIDDSNLLAMESCRGVVVASAIFGIDLSILVKSL